MVGFIDRSWFFCSSRSLFESMMKVTPFCIITGKQKYSVAIYMQSCKVRGLFWIITLYYYGIMLNSGILEAMKHMRVFIATGDAQSP